MVLFQHGVQLVAGISFFMYGMMLAAENLQNSGADQVRIVMSRLARHSLLGVMGGIILTVLLQSSSASTVLLVNLANAGVVTLNQVMGVIIGATVGTTITVQLISFRVTDYALVFVIVGFSLIFAARNKKVKGVGKIIFGFGMIFYGLLLMNEAIAFVKEMQGFREFFNFLGANPYFAFMVTTIFTAGVHSSAVTIGLAMTLASHGVITLQDSLFWIYGANLGTTATALMASFRGNYLGRQVAWAHFLYKALSCLLFVFITIPFGRMMAYVGSDIAHQVANAHTIFNVISAILFFPFINLGVRVVEKLFPRPQSEREFGPKYLDKEALHHPPTAFSNAIREMQRMAEYTLELVRASLKAFERDDPDFRNDLGVMDRQIDILNREIKLYLIKLSDQPLTELQNSRVVNLIALVNDIENIGDVIDKTVMVLAQKKAELKISFSEEGWRDMQEFHGVVIENFQMALSAFNLNNKEIAQKAVANKATLRLLEAKFREAHFKRLRRKLQDSLNTSNIHMDLLSAYRRVYSYIVNIVYPVIYGDPRQAFPAGTKDPFRGGSGDGSSGSSGKVA